MPRTSHKRRGSNTPTRIDRLLRVLEDGHWHSTADLIRHVGHTFSGAKFALARRGVIIEIRRHPRKAHQYQYRLTGRKGSWLPPLAVKNQGGRTNRRARKRRNKRTN